MIYTILFITAILIIWFNTDAFVEYMNLFHISFFKIKEYNNAKNNDCTLTYHNFLLYNYNNFFTRLITCPICTSVWLSIIIGTFSNIDFFQYPVLFIISLYLYEIYNKLTGYENK